MKRGIEIVCGTLLLALPTEGQVSGWSIESTPSSKNLYGVAFQDSSTWIAVGDSGTILRSTDGGVQWVEQSNPSFDAMRGVSFYGSIGMAVGFGGEVLLTTDGGSTWAQRTKPTTNNLYAVSIGKLMTVATGELGGIFVTTDSGAHWVQRSAGTTSGMFGISLIDSLGVAAGGPGTIVNSTDAGASWTIRALLVRETSFLGCAFADSALGWVVGSHSVTGGIILRSTDSGFSWVSQTTPTTFAYFGVAAPARDSATAVGDVGTIIHTTDAGQSWLPQPSGVTKTLNAVAFITPRHGIAVGDGGTILRTTTGGVTGVDEPRHTDQRSPERYLLAQNFPDPFNPETRIRFRIPERTHVVLTVYDLSGRSVATVVDESLAPGEYERILNASHLASGVYFYRLRAGGFSDTKKLVLAK